MKCVSSRVFQQIIFGMLSTTVALTGLGAMSLQPALAANSVALPTVKTQQSASVTPSQATSSIQQSYGGLQGMWEAVYKLGDTAREASKQGTYWTPRADWLDYYSTTMAQAIAALEQEMNSTVFPADKQALVSDNWNQIRSILNDITTHYKDFADSIKGDQQTLLKAAFHGPAKAIAQDADKLDQLLITVNARISNHSGDSPIQAQQSTAALANSVYANLEATPASNSSPTLKGGVQVLQSNVGVKAIGEAADKVHQAAFGMIGELERWNLLWGQPTGNQNAGYFYGGGLTPQEVLTQYKYLPQVAFTFPFYLQHFSYRLPPREKFLVMYTTEIGKLINLMNTDINNTQLPEAPTPLLSGQWQSLQDTFKDTVSQYMNLLRMVNEATDERLKQNIRQDELNFGQPVVAIYDNMDKIKRILADVSQVLPN